MEGPLVACARLEEGIPKLCLGASAMVVPWWWWCLRHGAVPLGDHALGFDHLMDLRR